MHHSSSQPSQRVEHKHGGHGGHKCNHDAILGLFVFCPQGIFLTDSKFQWLCYDASCSLNSQILALNNGCIDKNPKD